MKDRKKMIEDFVIDLFDDTVSEKQVVTNYLEISENTNNKISLSERRDGALGIINASRSGEIDKGAWLVPNYEIKKISKPKVYPFVQYRHLNIFKFNVADELTDHMFVLLDDDKDNILQYFLLNKTNTKILSFSLLVKEESTASFFVF
jgi:hypothetical protein